MPIDLQHICRASNKSAVLLWWNDPTSPSMRPQLVLVVSMVYNRNVYHAWPMGNSLQTSWIGRVSCPPSRTARADCSRFLRSRAASSPPTKRCHRLDAVHEIYANAGFYTTLLQDLRIDLPTAHGMLDLIRCCVASIHRLRGLLTLLIRQTHDLTFNSNRLFSDVK